LAKKNIEDEDNFFDDEFDDEDDFEDLCTDKIIQTPIGSVNEFTYLKNVFNQLYSDNKSYYEQILKVLNSDQQNVLKLVFDGAAP